MQDIKLLSELLEAEDETAVVAALTKRGLFEADAGTRWKYLGNTPNNQSIVHNQQSTAAAALVEKFTNGVDAILLKHCKSEGVDPRGHDAPKDMADAIEKYFGSLDDLREIRGIAESNLILYATGSKPRPCLSLYDAGEGQLAENFPNTFCSLVYASSEGSYKGAIPFVQGRFNMGGTGVLPFCSDKHKLQLIVSRVPHEVAKTTNHEWAFTLFCFFPHKQNPSWKYLVGTDGRVLTAGDAPLHLIPKAGAKSGEVCAPRERAVPSGTLIKMYDFKAPKSNICGELFKKLQEYLLRPALPLRVIECRKEYSAKVMGVTIWDRFGAWAKKLEEGFEDGASISVKLESGEEVPAEVRVFKAGPDGSDADDAPQTGLRALINGQSHAKRDSNFFRTKAVDKDHIAGSMLVTLDCTDLGQDTRNLLFMSNRETFRDDPLLHELLSKLQKELRHHDGLNLLNQKRYEEKVKNAVDDNDGINALEELLSTDPNLAELFGGLLSGKTAAKTSNTNPGGKEDDPAKKFIGLEYPTYFRRKEGSTQLDFNIEPGDTTRISFLTDVKNNYFSRKKNRGKCNYSGDVIPSLNLFNGRIYFTFTADKKAEVGSAFTTVATITDANGSGPFQLTMTATVVAPQVIDKESTPKPPQPPKTQSSPSRPDIKEMPIGPDAPPLTIEKVPNTERLQLVLNTSTKYLEDAKSKWPLEEALAVTFVFKYGLALAAMGLIDNLKKTSEWEGNQADCLEKIQQCATGIAKVIVPISLSLPKKLPKP